MDITKLINDLNCPVEADRLYAAEDLGAVDDDAAVAALSGRLSVESSQAVKEAIFHAMGRVHSDSVMRAAIKLIDVDDAFVRNEAVRLLGTFGPEAIPALARAIGGQDTDARKFALDAIAAIDSDLKDEIYLKLLSDPDINLIITAVEHIGLDNKTSLRENVELILEQAMHPMLISACVGALGQIGNAGSLEMMFRKLGGDRMSDFQAPEFIRALGRLGTDEHINLLCQLVGRFPATVVDTGFDAFEAIRRRLSLQQAPGALLAATQSIVARSSDPLGRYKAVRALGLFADDSTRNSIQAYLENQDKMVRLAAVESIARWKTSESKQLLAGRRTLETDQDVLAAIDDAINVHTRNAA